jgi:glycosyltransferase involved in cell wall biosynthesis
MITDKRILLLSPFRPWPFSNGSITRTFYLARHLAEHNDLLFAYRGPGQVTALDFPHRALPHGAIRFAQLFNPGLLARVRGLLRRGEVDLVISSHLWAGLHGMLSRELGAVPWIHDHHNVEYERFRQVGNRAWPGIKLLERFVCQRADLVASVSSTDKDRLVRSFNLDPHSVAVIPNGADVAGLQRYQVDVRAMRRRMDLPVDGPLLLYFGSMTYAPNRQAVKNMSRYVIPMLRERLPDFTVAVAGAGLEGAHEESSHLRILGFVDDLVALIKSADLVIVPLTAGSGTRLKIVESAACGRRVLSTTIGCEGLYRDAFGEALVVADDWPTFAAAAARLAREKREVTLPASFCERYDWQQIFRRLEAPPVVKH